MKWIIIGIIVALAFYFLKKNETVISEIINRGTHRKQMTLWQKQMDAVSNHEYSVDEMRAMHERCVDMITYNIFRKNKIA